MVFWLLLASLVVVLGAPTSLDEVIASSACDLRQIQGYSEGLIRQVLCNAALNSTLINIYGPVELLPSTRTSLLIPMLQQPAAAALNSAAVTAVVSGRGPIRIRQALNSVIEAYVLWRWSLEGRCNVPYPRDYPARPKSYSFESGVRIEIADPLFWSDFLRPFNWFNVALSSNSSFGVFEYRGTIGSIRDVAYRQVLTWQQWHNANAPQSLILASGVFDARTQVRMDVSPALNVWPLTQCNHGVQGTVVTVVTTGNATRAAAPAQPPAATTEVPDNQGALALVIIVPMSVLGMLLAALLLFSLLSQGSGPRVPMFTHKRAHEDPNWISQHRRADVASAAPVVDEDVLDEWMQREYADPDVWTEVPTEFDTSDLESFVEHLKEDPDYVSKPKRSIDREQEPGVRSKSGFWKPPEGAASYQDYVEEDDDEVRVDASEMVGPSKTENKRKEQEEVAAAAAAPDSSYVNDSSEATKKPASARVQQQPAQPSSARNVKQATEKSTSGMEEEEGTLEEEEEFEEEEEDFETGESSSAM